MTDKLAKRVAALEDVNKDELRDAVIVFTEPGESETSIQERIQAAIDSGWNCIVVPQK